MHLQSKRNIQYKLLNNFVLDLILNNNTLDQLLINHLLIQERKKMLFLLYLYHLVNMIELL